MFSSDFSSPSNDQPSFSFYFLFPFCLASSSSIFVKNSSPNDSESKERCIGDGGREGDLGDP